MNIKSKIINNTNNSEIEIKPLSKKLLAVQEYYPPENSTGIAFRIYWVGGILCEGHSRHLRFYEIISVSKDFITLKQLYRTSDNDCIKPYFKTDFIKTKNGLIYNRKSQRLIPPELEKPFKRKINADFKSRYSNLVQIGNRGSFRFWDGVPLKYKQAHLTWGKD
jgi:hypothetical protein